MGKYEEIAQTQVAGLNEAIISVLSKHIGADAALSRSDLVTEVARLLGEKVHERKVREGIRALRRMGAPICGAAGEGGGYYLAANAEELEDFFRREFIAKIKDMRETMEAMKAAARLVFREGKNG